MSKTHNKDTIIKTSYTELIKFQQNNQHDKALLSVNRILGITPNDEKALHCKVICLIQLSRFTDAYQFIVKNNLNHLVFERAYCEYRLNQLKQALDTINSYGVSSTLTLNLSELKAQILYKLEKYNECYEIYKNIIKYTHDDYDQERKTNLSAVFSYLSNKEEEDSSIYSDESYELYYNNACALLNNGKYSEAEKKLRMCLNICRESLEEEGSSQDEIEEEMAIIRIQLAYCLQMQGNIKDASVIYSEFLRKKSKDTTLVAIVCNNTVVINKDQNVFDSKKKMRIALIEANEHKLTFNQKKIISINNCLLSLYTNSIDQCNDLCNKLVKTYPDLEFVASLIKCSCFCKEKNYNKAIGLLEYFENKNNLAAKFAVAQLHLLNGNKVAAINTLMSLGDLKYKPGVVSTLVTLFLSLDKRNSASDVLKSAVEWHKEKNVSNGHLSDMWRYAADFHIRGCAPENAASSLEELYKLNQKDMKVLAQLVIAYAQFDPEKAKELSKNLPELKSLTAAADIEILEATNWTMATKAVRKAVKPEQSPNITGSDSQKLKKKIKRKRKSILPKNCDTTIPPDPERWLPKYERTTYKKKRDRRTKDIVKGSQGTTSHSSDQFDMSKNISKPSFTPQEPISTPRAQHRKGIQKKKKGRHY